MAARKKLREGGPKPSTGIRVSEELRAKVEAYKVAHGYPSWSSALLWLVELGLKGEVKHE